MSATPSRKTSPAPIARAVVTRPLVGERTSAAPSYVATFRALRAALLLAPLGLAAACGATPARYAGTPPAVTPEPSSTTPSTTPSTAPSTTVSPPIAPSDTPPPAAGGLRPAMPETT